MVDLRRILLLVAVVAIAAPLAFGQGTAVTCTAQASPATIIRDVANADQAGDVILECTGGVPTAYNQPIPHVNIQVFYTLPVTSKAQGTDTNGRQLLESILIFDELKNENLTPRTIEPCLPTDPTWNAASERCDPLSSGQPKLNYFGSTVDANTGLKPNVFQAVSVPLATTSSQVYSIAFYGVPFDPPGTQTTRTLRITNVRLQAGGFSSGGGLPPAIVASVSFTNAQFVNVVQNTATVAYVQRTLAISTDRAPSFLQCESQLGYCPSFTVGFTELQSVAFKRQGSSSQNVPGQAGNTENMFTDSVKFTGRLSGAGVAKYATRLLARFENVPLGVTLYGTVRSRNYGSLVNAQALMVQGSVDYNGDGGAYSDSGADGTIPENCDKAKLGDAGYSDFGGYKVVKLRTGTVGGKNVAWGAWEVQTEDPAIEQKYEFGIVVRYTANTSADSPEVRDDTSFKGHLAPLNPTGVPATVSTAPTPRFNESNTVVNNILNISRCRTNLLYPFVAQSGVSGKSTFDTGIAISNTSNDPFSYTSTSITHPRAQTGACKIYFYGTTGVSDAPPAMATTPVIPAGKTYAFGLYGGSADGAIPQARGFVGYIIAVCDFQYAHGYAFISNVGAGEFAQGYVALVMDADLTRPDIPYTRTGSRSEPLNQ